MCGYKQLLSTSAFVAERLRGAPFHLNSLSPKLTLHITVDDESIVIIVSVCDSDG